MPGITLLSGEDADSSHVDPAFESVRFLDDYETHRAVETDRVTVGHTGYPEYPVERVETDDVVALLEGRLYDVDDERAHLHEVASLVRAGETERLREWIGERDGDFLVVVYDRNTEALWAVNDTFCRLPTYYTTVDGTVVVSRELKFVREMARRLGRPLELDQLGAAQQILFGYTLGERTVFEDVQTLAPGSKLHVAGDGDLETDRLYRHRFDEKAHDDRSVEENAAILADRFARACEDRNVDGGTNVVSLSGGLDSRAVVGAYDHLDVPCVAATFDTEDRTYEADSSVARDVADALGVDWDLYLSAATERNHERLLQMKQGMNYLGMTFILDFFDQLRAEHGRVNYLTGDGGDKVLVDLTPARSFDSLPDLTDYVIESNSRVPVETAAAVADVDGQRLRASVTEQIRSYPESDRSQQYAHFLVRERGFNFLNQGEDRNRYYFWSATPFYSLPVFEYAMKCPDEQKHQRALYSAFMERFSPELIDVEYPNFGAPITSVEYKFKRFVYDTLSRFPRLQSAVVDLVSSGSSDNTDVARRIQSQVGGSDVAPLSEDAITAVTNNHESYDDIPMNYLFTLTSLLRDMEDTARRPVTDANQEATPSVPPQ